MNVHISSSSCISAQNTFGDKDWHKNVKMPENGLFHCIEPDYKNFIDSAVSRRMNRLQKQNLCTVIDCLKDANLQIDASIFSTGWGCVESTYKFLERLFDNQNLPPNPAVFIQSTHNAPASQTAAFFKCNAYNNVLSDNQLPFELALDNAILCLHENDCSNVLVGSYDELTPQLTDILQNISISKNNTVLGEGSACFVLSKEKESAIAKITHFESFDRTGFDRKLKDLCKTFAVDCIFMQKKENLSVNLPQIIYTDYFGIFPTCSACGFWLAVNSVSIGNQIIPQSNSIMLISENKYKTVYVTVVESLSKF